MFSNSVETDIFSNYLLLCNLNTYYTIVCTPMSLILLSTVCPVHYFVPHSNHLHCFHLFSRHLDNFSPQIKHLYWFTLYSQNS